MPVSRVGAREASLVDEATEPVALPEADGAPQRQDDITPEWTEAVPDEERRRFFSHRIGSRAVWLPLVCVAALLVGFGIMTVLLRLGDRPAQSDTKPVPTTEAPLVPPPSAAPAVTAPPTSAAGSPAIENDPAPPAPPPVSAPPDSAPPDSAPTPSDATSPPNLNPVGHTPPGRN